MSGAAVLTITDFLLARIAEDEAAALKVQHAWSSAVHEVGLFGDMGDYAELVDPARVLAECEAHRRIVEDEHFDGRSGEHIAPFCATCSDDENLVDLPCRTLRFLAAIYSDHSLFREEWRP